MLKHKIIIFLILLSKVTVGQSIFDKYEGVETVTSVVVTNKLFELMSKVKADTTDKEAQQFMAFIKKLDNLKVFTTINSKMALDMKIAADKYLKTASLDELMRVNDGNKNIKIYVKEGSNSNRVKELFMFIEGSGKDNPTVILSLTGDFDLNEIAALTNKMNIPGADELRRASKGSK